MKGVTKGGKCKTGHGSTPMIIFVRFSCRHGMLPMADLRLSLPHLVAVSTNCTARIVLMDRLLMPNASHLNLSRYVPGLLTFLTNKLATGASHCYRKHFGIGVVEWRMLSMLAVENHITAGRITQVIGLDKSAVSRSLQSLEKAGYVSSEVDAIDARRYTVSLTESGRVLHDRVLTVALERERRLLTGLSPEEIDVLVNLLGRLHLNVDHVNDYDPKQPRENGI